MLLYLIYKWLRLIKSCIKPMAAALHSLRVIMYLEIEGQEFRMMIEC